MEPSKELTIDEMIVQGKLPYKKYAVYRLRWLGGSFLEGLIQGVIVKVNYEDPITSQSSILEKRYIQLSK